MRHLCYVLDVRVKILVIFNACIAVRRKYSFASIIMASFEPIDEQIFQLNSNNNTLENRSRRDKDENIIVW